MRRLTKIATDKIDIHYNPEFAERFALKFVIGFVVKVARKKISFAKLRANAKNFAVPESDSEIESLVAGD